MEGEEAGELLQGGGGNLGKQGDRVSLELPQVQQDLLERLLVLQKKTIILNFSGGCIDLRAYKNRADAMLQCWYPGASGGKAIANLLFGAASPSGKLPVTFYNDVQDLPDFADYSMQNRSYRYYAGAVQYPFGYGLTYTRFTLTACTLQGAAIHCTVKNSGSVPCDEVLQLYVSYPETDYRNPICTLVQVQRQALQPGEAKAFAFPLQETDFYSIDADGNTLFLAGTYTVQLSDG